MARERGPDAGHECLWQLGQARCASILGRRTSSRTRCAYYWKPRRRTEFEQKEKMAAGSVGYREVQVPLQKAAAKRGTGNAVAIVSLNDEKPGIKPCDEPRAGICRPSPACTPTFLAIHVNTKKPMAR